MIEINKEAFIEEARELLAELEESLLKLEEMPDSEEHVNRVFRAMHTIKGSGAMFGFDDIAAFTHEVETVFDKVRGSEIPVTQELIDLTLLARDHLWKMVNGESDEAASQLIVDAFRNISGAKSTGAGKASEPEEKAIEQTFRIRFRPNPETLKAGTDPLRLLEELRALGDCKFCGHVEDVPPLEELDPSLCHLRWDAVLTTSAGINAIRDIFIFVEDDYALSIDLIDEEEDEAALEEIDYKRIGEILVERGDVPHEEMEAIAEGRKKVGELLVEGKIVNKSKVASALIEQDHVRNLRKGRHSTRMASSLRVSTDRLDRLVDLVGELVTVQARLSRLAALKKDPEFFAVAEVVERLTAELRDQAMGIRMLPFGSTFSQFKRLVRDLARDLNKEVVLITEGGDTELDKTVIERLHDPLVHIIRNSIDHGIESAEARKAAEKPSHGTVFLSASHSGAQVLITIRDDGKGLDPEAIRSKAVEKGIIPPDADLSEKDVLALIFAPGFSTAQNVTDVSGRGVGMDVVKRSIEELRGHIELDSKPGAGTTITLKLPLTLAIIDGLLVDVGDTKFVFPLAAVEECVELTRAEILKSNGRHIANVRGELIPYIVLRKLFQMEGELPEICQIAVARQEGLRTGFVVDRVIGQHQTVIKNLGKVYRGVEGISGATILGDGRVALILDLPQLMQTVAREEDASPNRQPLTQKAVI